MDFIKKPLLFFGFDTILVIVNQLTKQVIFISSYDTIISINLKCLFILYMFSKNSVSFHVTSNRGSEFILNFFHSLGTTLDIKLHFTLGYYPKGNGQTEHPNQTLEQYLHIYCNYQQDNWFEFLLFVDFAYNNTLSATTSISPFFVNKGYYPNITVHSEYNITSS